MKLKKLLPAAASLALTLAACSASPAAMPATMPSNVLQAIQSRNWDKVQQAMSERFARAADVSPGESPVGTWVDQYSQLSDKFRADRKKSFDNSVRDTKILLKGGFHDLALDGLASSYLLTEDKGAFVNQGWVKNLIAEAIDSAKTSSDKGEWLKSRRIYDNLSVIEPTQSKWTHAREDAIRRIRLLSRYSPDAFTSVLAEEATYRKAARKLLVAATQPATQSAGPTTGPATGPSADAKTEDEDVAVFKSDWHDDLRGVNTDMVREAIVDARSNYFRDIKYPQLLDGGISSLRILATTPGLEKTFESLADKTKRDRFLSVLDAAAKQVDAKADRETANAIVTQVIVANSQTLNLPESVLISEFADGAFATLDPFSTMIWPTDVAEFNKATQGEFSGVGISIQADEAGGLKVISPLEDSPALKAGIRAGDVITAIDGKSAKGITTTQAVRVITGPSGSPVTLTVRRPDETVKDFTLIRQTIKVASIKGWSHTNTGGWDYMIDPQSKIAYIRLTNFTRDSSDEMETALAQVKKEGAKGLIFDLRGNPGGLLTAATEIADAFLDHGNIVSTRSDRDDPNAAAMNAHASRDDVVLPLVVLVNQYSASASEIVSGALKDQKRATLVGERTYGKGSVQMLFPLDQRHAYLKLTTSHYYLPSGRCIHREENATEWGVDPDLSVEMTPEQMRQVIDARNDLDVLYDDDASRAKQADVRGKLMDVDLQLNAALLVMRLDLAEGQPK